MVLKQNEKVFIFFKYNFKFCIYRMLKSHKIYGTITLNKLLRVLSVNMSSDISFIFKKINN